MRNPLAYRNATVITAVIKVFSTGPKSQCSIILSLSLRLQKNKLECLAQQSFSKYSRVCQTLYNVHHPNGSLSSSPKRTNKHSGVFSFKRKEEKKKLLCCSNTLNTLLMPNTEAYGVSVYARQNLLFSFHQSSLKIICIVVLNFFKFL